MKDGVENYEGYKAIKIPSTGARTKLATVATFKRYRFDRVTRTRVNKQCSIFNSGMQAYFGSLLCSAKTFREGYVETYKKFNGVDFSSTRARTKVLASFEAGHFYLIRVKRQCMQLANSVLRSSMSHGSTVAVLLRDFVNSCTVYYA